MNESSLI